MDVAIEQAARVGWARVAALAGGAIAASAEQRCVDLAAEFAAGDGGLWLPEQGALAVWIADWWLLGQARAANAAPGRVLGISGAQGTGKSTFVAHLAQALVLQGQNVAVLSLDDLYLSQRERRKLARTVHPLLATRGVPGTHDLELGNRVLDDLARTPLAAARRMPNTTQSVALPRFDKSRDDPAPPSAWPRVMTPCDTVLLEGWCVGIAAQQAAELVQPCNELEAVEDADGRWRSFVNDQLATRYTPFFARCAALIALLPPDFAAVRRWRGLQEQALPAARRMHVAALDRFIAHYERLTRHGVATLPTRADIAIQLAPDHRIAAIARAAP